MKDQFRILCFMKNKLNLNIIDRVQSNWSRTPSESRHVPSFDYEPYWATISARILKFCTSSLNGLTI